MSRLLPDHITSPDAILRDFLGEHLALILCVVALVAAATVVLIVLLRKKQRRK
jgi:hypothetical protein